MIRIKVVSLVALGAICLACFSFAAEFKVNSAGDEPDYLPGDGLADIGILLPEGTRIPSGITTLRAALDEANAGPDKDIIRFDLPGKSSIQIKGPLRCRFATEIQGMDSSDSLALRVELTGNEFEGLSITTNCVVQGLALNSPVIGKQHTLLSVVGHGCVVRDNLIGMAPSGLEAWGFYYGISAAVNGSIVIEQNVISSGTNGGTALYLTGIFLPNECLIRKNMFGTDSTGTNALGNSRGIDIHQALGFVVGDLQDGIEQANLIVGSAMEGIRVNRSEGIILGNLIGVGMDGATPLPNGDGIRVSGYDSQVQIGLLDTNWIQFANVISGNRTNGVIVGDDNPAENPVSDTIITGNLIGTDAEGVSAVPNGTGIYVAASATNTFIGTTNALNLISGNRGDGLVIRGVQTTVQHNIIGADMIGLPLGNGGNGIRVSIASGVQPLPVPNVLIGGSDPTEGNAILFNHSAGVSVAPPGEGTCIWGTEMYGNHSLGIDLWFSASKGADGISRNAATENINQQNYPVLTNLVWKTNALIPEVIQGYLRSGVNQNYRLEIFSTPEADRSSFGEGTSFLGSTNVLTDSSGYVSFAFIIPEGATAETNYTATATGLDAKWLTSEFSQIYPLPSLEILVNELGDQEDPFPGDGIADIDPATSKLETTLRAALQTANARPGKDQIRFHLLVPEIDVTKPLPVISEPVEIDGSSQPDDQFVVIAGEDAGLDTDGLVIQAGDSLVQNLAIVKFGGNGLRLERYGNNKIFNNFIGCVPNQTNRLGNGRNGIRINGSHSNLIGRPHPEEGGNVIVNNGAAGILIDGSFTKGNVIVQNLIGVAEFLDLASITNILMLPMGNTGPGIFITDDSYGNTIGGLDAADANFIMYNAREGVLIDSGVRNGILINIISDNGLLGIDLGGYGVTENDPSDTDTGPNQFQNFPELASAIYSNRVLTISGEVTLQPAASGSRFRLHFYYTSKPDLSEYGQAETFLGVFEANRTSVHNAFVANLEVGAFIDGWVCATATDADNNTSEFSKCIHLVNASGPSDGDQDGIADSVEDAGPNQGDGNRDGQLDSQQKEVAALKTSTGRYLVIVAPNGVTLQQVRSEPAAESTPPPSAVSFLYGAFTFTLPSSTPEHFLVEFVGSPDAPVNAFYSYAPGSPGQWVRYDVTESSVQPQSTGIRSAAVATAVSAKLSRLFKDGAWGDSDGEVNGVIKVVGALAVDATPRFLLIQRMPNGIVKGQLEGWPGNKYRIEGSTDLKTWSPVWIENLLQTPLDFEDFAAQLQPRQFYRALWLPE